MGKYIVGVCEGGELLCREAPLPRAPSPKRRQGGTLGGEAASLREAPLPPDPSLPKSGWRLAGLLLLVWFRLRGGAFVTCRRWGNEPLRPPMAGTSPFRGGFAGNGAKRLPRQRELSDMRLTEGKPFCWETHSCGGKSISSTIRCRGWFPSFCGRRRGVAAKPPQVSVSTLPFRGGGRSPYGSFAIALCETFARSPLIDLCRYPTLAGRGGSVSRRDRDRVASESTPNLQAEPTMKKRINSNASRFPEGSAREGPFSERPPPSQISHVPYFQLLFGRGGLGERRFS